jgi:hypothetical protein
MTGNSILQRSFERHVPAGKRTQQVSGRFRLNLAHQSDAASSPRPLKSFGEYALAGADLNDIGDTRNAIRDHGLSICALGTQAVGAITVVALQLIDGRSIKKGRIARPFEFWRM